LSGTTELHEELQNKIAAFKHRGIVPALPSGYSANVGIIAGLMRPGDLVVTDQFAHASIVDGIILSKAQVRYFRHNNAADLDRKLKDFSGRKLVIVEGVYSMDGDLANLPEIVEVAQRNGARIMIDEAHSAFLFGKNGRGVAEHFGLDDEIDIHLGTFSKSLGGQGGYVVGRQAHPLPQGIRALARVLVRTRAGRGRRAHQGVRDRARRAAASRPVVGEHRSPAGAPSRAQCRHRRFQVAGDPDHDSRRRPRLQGGRGHDPPRRVSESRALPRGGETPLAAADIGHRVALRRGPARGGRHHARVLDKHGFLCR
jgi:hypothetical protein